MQKFPLRDLLIIIAIAAIGRLLLLASGAVSFHSDEAVVALMARHINEGARPVFFYGQAYMGSLDAWLVAIGFQLFGESVMNVRIVQSVLYMLVIATGYTAAWQFSGRRIVAAVAGLLLAIPAVNTVLYTTATLGGYNEILLLGNLIIIFGHRAIQPAARWWSWAGLGLAAGVGWWTSGLIVMYAVPVGLMILIVWLKERRHIRHLLPGLALALVYFFIGSAPWWIFDFTHDHAALATYLSSQQSGEFEGIGIPYVPPQQRLIGLLVIGLPTLIGMRFPWSPEYFLLPLGALALLIYITSIYRLARADNSLEPYARLLVLLMLLVFVVIFIASTFGADPTGRYFLPLVLPIGIAFGALVDHLWHQERASVTRVLAAGLVLLIAGYHASGQAAAAQSPTGLTAQFDLISHIPNDHDAEVIEFLEANDLRHGQTNYWVAYRLAFLSGEQLQYNASLPYKADLSYNAADQRYKPYTEATQAAERIAYITTKLPELDAYLQSEWQGIMYETTQIGEYHIYYNFSSPPPLPNFEKP
jgi:4-amino-4-deoxy-L-arabinose transferase-like glycosyltransferase